MSRKPAVFVSSTCYDLRQIRSDLNDFISKDLGYDAFLSETSSFPIDPDVSTIDNCRARVQNQADILLLVIGGRYGSIDKDTAKSITNIEYLTARAKGIPIYAFVDRQILPVMRVWQANKDANFSGQVDNVKIFEFIEQVRSQVWTNEFDTAQDITTALRAQFAFLVSEGLKRNLQLKKSSLLGKLDQSSPNAFRIALEQPPGWEFHLLAQALDDEVEKNDELRREHRVGIVHGRGEYISPNEFFGWVDLRSEEIVRLLTSADKIISTLMNEATGESGVPGDAVAIVFSARQLGSIHRQLIEWSQRILRVSVDEDYKELLRIFSTFADDIVVELEGASSKIKDAVNEVLVAVDNGKTASLKIDLSFRLPEGRVEEFLAATRKLEHQVNG